MTARSRVGNFHLVGSTCGLALLAAALPARAMLFCVAQDRSTGAIRENATIHLRSVCNSREKALPISLEGDGVVRFTGVDVQIVSGAGATEAPPNGKGNLIMGYDEGRYHDDDGRASRPCFADADCAIDGGPCDFSGKTGSHNLVIGVGHQYSSVGSLVAGRLNDVVAPGTSVTGGTDNRAERAGASVNGGIENVASGLAAAVAGGRGSHARGDISAVAGGLENLAAGTWAVVVGGHDNAAFESGSVIVGGESNVAGAFASVLVGGLEQGVGAQYGVCGGDGDEYCPR